MFPVVPPLLSLAYAYIDPVADFPIQPRDLVAEGALVYLVYAIDRMLDEFDIDSDIGLPNPGKNNKNNGLTRMDMVVLASGYVFGYDYRLLAIAIAIVATYKDHVKPRIGPAKNLYVGAWWTALTFGVPHLHAATATTYTLEIANTLLCAGVSAHADVRDADSKDKKDKVDTLATVMGAKAARQVGNVCVGTGGGLIALTAAKSVVVPALIHTVRPF